MAGSSNVITVIEPRVMQSVTCPGVVSGEKGFSEVSTEIWSIMTSAKN